MLSPFHKKFWLLIIVNLLFNQYKALLVIVLWGKINWLLLPNITIIPVLVSLLYLVPLSGNAWTLSGGKEPFRPAWTVTEGHKSPCHSVRQPHNKTAHACASWVAPGDIPACSCYSCSCQIAVHAWRPFVPLMLIFILDLSLAVTRTQLLAINVVQKWCFRSILSLAYFGC